MDSESTVKIKLKQQLLNNYYACLSPPPCQVEEQENEQNEVEQGKGAIRFNIPKRKSRNKSTKMQMERYNQAKANKQALTATQATQYREIPWADMKAAIASRQGTEESTASVIAVATMASLQRAKRDKVPQKDLVYVIDHDDEQMRCGVWTGTIPSSVVDSGATSSVGTAEDKCCRTGQASNKVFILPGGQTVVAS